MVTLKPAPGRGAELHLKPLPGRGAELHLKRAVSTLSLGFNREFNERRIGPVLPDYTGIERDETTGRWRKLELMGSREAGF